MKDTMNIKDIMKNTALAKWRTMAASIVAAAAALTAGAAERTLPLATYRDKMKAAWIGQIAGVSWGGPTEFRYNHKIIPASEWKPWTPDMINHAFWQDDVYVEMTFLRTMEKYGYGVSQRQAAIDFANSQYRLWHANAEGRNQLRRGVAPPDSGNPRLNKCANDIDYQIEADYSGVIAPGLPQAAIRLGEKFGGIMNYADGKYAGQFIGALYCAAYFETNLVKVVETALAAIPPKCRYAQMVRDLLKWHAEDPNDWEKAWQKIDDTYGHEGPCPAQPDVIEATLNGAQVLLGILWGNGDLDKTIEISCRGGFDSDCNPSSAAGVVFATVGYDRLPARFKEKLNLEGKFEFTDYTVPDLLAVTEKIARQVVVAEGGRIVNDPVLGEAFVIPVKRPTPSPMEDYKNPKPLANSRFTPAEMAQIRFEPCAWGQPSQEHFGTTPRAYTNAAGKVLRYRWAEPAKVEPGKTYPLVVLFHGAGERGSDNVSQLKWGAGPILRYMAEKGIEGYFIAGQVPDGQQWVNTPWAAAAHRMDKEPSEAMALALALVDQTCATLPIDRSRVYATGVSMGGYGTWDAIQRRPDLFAAAMPICGGGDAHLVWKIRETPIWAWHGSADDVVPVSRSRDMVSALWAVDGNVRYTEVPGCGHASWIPAYDSKEALGWLFSQKR